MTIKGFLYFTFFFCSINFTSAQIYLQGIVLDSLSGQPLEGASIYFNGSQSGTISNKKGKFTLKLPSEPQQLIFSAVGYKLGLINTADLSNTAGSEFEIKLIRKENEMEEVVVTSAAFIRVNGRSWRKKFRDYFIGTGAGAAECDIVNFEDIILKFSERHNILKAQSNKTIEIINKWLGYKIYFDMEECTININLNSFYYYGYSRFEDISNGSKKIQKRREDAYRGSLPHFLKSLYNNSQQSQGFEVRHARVFPNTERDRIKQLMKENKSTLYVPSETLQIGNSSIDSSAYYYKVYVKEKDQIINIDSTLLNANSLFITDLEMFKELYFNNYLLVTYKNKSSEQLRLQPVLPALEINKGYENSLLSLKDNNSVFVFPDGRVSPPKILSVQGYWYTINNIKNMLPSDY